MVDAQPAAPDPAQRQASVRSERLPMGAIAAAIVATGAEYPLSTRARLALPAAVLILVRHELLIPRFDRRLLREDPETALRLFDVHRLAMAPLVADANAALVSVRAKLDACPTEASRQ